MATRQARQAISRAEEEARSLGRDQLAPEHILLGALQEMDGPTASAVAGLGLSYAAALPMVEEIAGRGDGSATDGRLPFTAEAREALILANGGVPLDETNVQHLLVGLLKYLFLCDTPEKSMLAKVFAALKVDPTVLEHALKELDSERAIRQREDDLNRMWRPVDSVRPPLADKPENPSFEARISALEAGLARLERRLSADS